MDFYSSSLFMIINLFMGQKEELLSQMSDEELVKTINSILVMTDSEAKQVAASLVVKEASRRKETTNKELLDFQDFIVNTALKSIEKLKK
jgi:hypothetical protein